MQTLPTRGENGGREGLGGQAGGHLWRIVANQVAPVAQFLGDLSAKTGMSTEPINRFFNNSPYARRPRLAYPAHLFGADRPLGEEASGRS